jgi:hypothetical protein
MVAKIDKMSDAEVILSIDVMTSNGGIAFK